MLYKFKNEADVVRTVVSEAPSRTQDASCEAVNNLRRKLHRRRRPTKNIIDPTRFGLPCYAVSDEKVDIHRLAHELVGLSGTALELHPQLPHEAGAFCIRLFQKVQAKLL